MKEIKKDNGIVTNLEHPEVEELYSNEFEGKTRVSAHVSQKKVTVYPSQRMDTGFGDGLFKNSPGNEYTSTRHTLVVVPEGLSKESVQDKVDEFPDACIYRKLSNNLDEVISSKENQAIESGLINKENLKPRYLVQDSEGNVYSNMTTDGELLEDKVVGKIVTTPEGKVLEVINPNALFEYKRDIFSREYQEDNDMRETVNAIKKVLEDTQELAV